MNSVKFLKSYKPEDDRNIYFIAIWLTVLLIACIKGLFVVYETESLNTFIFIVFMSIAYLYIYVFFWSRWLTSSNYLFLTENSIIGQNHFKRKIGELYLNDIVEIFVKKGSYLIKLKDKNDNILKINGVDYTENLLNDLIPKLPNCRKIDIKYLKGRFPNIIVYERGL